MNFTLLFKGMKCILTFMDIYELSRHASRNQYFQLCLILKETLLLIEGTAPFLTLHIVDQ